MQFDLFDETQNRILDSSDYRTFKERLASSHCDRCGLSQSRTHIVVDRGNPEAKILIVGEGPGENEDKQAQAFVGRAGKLMDSLFQEIGLETNQDTLIANIVKCRPPENRAPRHDEVNACLPFLKKQIALVDPRLIVLLGATALKHLVREKTNFSMESEAGKIFQSQDFPQADLMVLYHPAYLLYDPRKTPTMQTHLQALLRYLQEKKIPPKG